MRQTEVTVSDNLRDLMRVIQCPLLQAQLLGYLARRAVIGDTVLLHVAQVELPTLEHMQLYVPATVNGLSGALIATRSDIASTWNVSTHT